MAYSAKQITGALARTQGMVHLAAEYLKCTPQTIYNHINRSPAVRAAWEYEREKMLDIGELKLYEGVIAREPWAVTLLLKTKGKNRGYAERSERTGAGGQPIRQQTEVRHKLELSKLNVQELENLRDLIGRAAADVDI